jgi:uncharacterized membrane protein (DUF485 family)
LTRPRWRGASVLVLIVLAVLLGGIALIFALGGYSVVPDAVLLIGFLLVAFLFTTDPTQPQTRLLRVSMVFGVATGLGGVVLQIKRLLVTSGMAAPSSNWPVTILLVLFAVSFIVTQVAARRALKGLKRLNAEDAILHDPSRPEP